LQLRFKSEGYLLQFAVKTIETAPESSPPFGRRVMRVTGAKAIWCGRFSLESSPPDEVSVSTYTYEPESLTSRNLELEQKQTPSFEVVTGAGALTSEAPSATDIEQELTLDLKGMAFGDAPQPGALMRIEVRNQLVLMTVKRVSMVRNQAEGEGRLEEFARVTGPAVTILRDHPTPLPLRIPTVESLTFELWVRDGDKNAISLSDLAFGSAHENFWGLLPTDEKLYREAEMGKRSAPAIVWWRPAGDVMRFPLAGGQNANELFFPLGMPAIPDEYQRPVRLPGTTLERDGLASFDAGLFLDGALLDASVETLLSQAEFLRYLSARPRALRGIHAAVGND